MKTDFRAFLQYLNKTLGFKTTQGIENVRKCIKDVTNEIITQTKINRFNFC